MSLLKEIEQKIESATKQLTENQGLLSQKSQQIEQLTNDKGTIIALIHQLNGYLTLAHDMKSKLAPVVDAAESVVEDVLNAADSAK